MPIRQALIQDVVDERITSLFQMGVRDPNFFLLSATTTGSTATVLTINGVGTAATNSVPVPNESVLGVFAMYTYFNVTDDEGGLGLNAFLIENDGGTTALIGAVSSLINTAAADVAQINDGSATSTIAYTADDTNDVIAATVTGTAAKTIYHRCLMLVIPIFDPATLVQNTKSGLGI